MQNLRFPLCNSQSELFGKFAPRALENVYTRVVLTTLNNLPQAKKQRHTAAGLPEALPDRVLINRSEACLWQSGRDAESYKMSGQDCDVMIPTLQ